jgi:hypothetical protein
MAKTVNEAFNEFNKDSVNLDSDRTKVARSSRDWLIGQLITLPDKVDDFPKLYENMHIKYGSFARNTKISPLDDIDLMLTFTGAGATYLTITYGQNYILNVPESATLLRKLCNDNGTLNSIKVVNKIVSSLDKIEHYKSAAKHRRQEAATLDLTSYEWVFDIVPSFYTDTNYYIIPDGQGGWKASDPRIDQDRITTINQKYNGQVLQLIRTLKYWNRRAAMTTIPSYLFETIVLNFIEGREKLSEYIDVNLINFWFYLKDAIYNNVNDPKGFQGNLNTLTYSEKTGISSKANDAYSKGYEAYKFETEEKNQSKAINKWIEIFGDKFPKYE